MQTLKKLISRYMSKITCVLVVVILIILISIQIIVEHRRAYESGIRTITQIESVLDENQQELTEIEEEYRLTCLHNAETVARIIESEPELLDNIEALKEIAISVEVDEIHIFDTTGRIFTGTHPQHYDFTFDSDEQMTFFKPMLEDKSLKLVQDIAPNAIEEKTMQYSAVWSESGTFIVQVGMEPVNIIKLTEKNELSHIFSLFRVNPEAHYYAINAQSGEIVGSTELETVGLNAYAIGFDMNSLQTDVNGFHARINNIASFCVFEKIGENYIGRIIESSSLYYEVFSIACWTFISVVIVAIFLGKAVAKHMNQYVVMEIDDINDKLKSIASGNLEESVNIQSSVEFMELSNYVNSMVKSLLDNNKRMSYVLNETHMHIGTYEYGANTKKIRYTEYIPKILSLSDEEMEDLALNTAAFTTFLDMVRKYPIPNEQKTYRFGKQYIRLTEIIDDDKVFGVAIDVTSDITKRIEIEKERDVDTLTGLYNRRGLEIKLALAFNEPETLKHSAIVMIDADGLKGINDTYGHEKGDIYLKKIGEIIANVETKNSIASRQGGDEFVLFLYGYENENKLIHTIESLEKIQDNNFVTLDKNIIVPIRFSFGYSLVKGENDYQALMKEADEKMYQHKLARKKNANR